jgi:hypothetical protein
MSLGCVWWCNRAYVSAPCAKLICENTDELSLMYHSWLFAEDGLGDETVDRQETILVILALPKTCAACGSPFLLLMYFEASHKSDLNE